MNIKIVDSWLREFIDTKASIKDIARELSLRSVSVEKIEKTEDDYVYDIEVTTNRVDLMSVKAIAKETVASLNLAGIKAKFIEPNVTQIDFPKTEFPIKIEADPKLVNRICAVVLEVEVGQSTKEISKRLELSGIRSLNNLIDVTNYIMRQVGHPAHVFDYDLLSSKKIIIRESKAGEKIETLDKKIYTLLGGDIVADDGTGKIIDLLGIMGTKNSVVKNDTKKILFFLDNNNPLNIRKTSMSLGIRTEAAIINEKGIDPNLMDQALLLGIELYGKLAKGKVISPKLDIYSVKPKPGIITVSFEKIDKIVGIEIKPEECLKIMLSLGLKAKKFGGNLEVEIPTDRTDLKNDEDIIEEIARMYGYDKLPSVIPTFLSSKQVGVLNNFFFEERIKNALKYYGFTEIYTNSLISEDLYQGPLEEALKVANPLSYDLMYLRNSLIPSLLSVIKENITKDSLNIFELANIYIKERNDLPNEIMMLSAVVKKQNANFYEVKGLIETLLFDLGIQPLTFKKSEKNATGSSVYSNNELLGEIEVLDSNLVDFELNFEKILKHASLKKRFTPFAKFPPIIEDISVIADTTTQELINTIKSQDKLIVDVELKDEYKNSRTLHITYQDLEKNLTTKDVALIREKIVSALKEKFGASIKE